MIDCCCMMFFLVDLFDARSLLFDTLIVWAVVVCLVGLLSGFQLIDGLFGWLLVD